MSGGGETVSPGAEYIRRLLESGEAELRSPLWTFIDEPENLGDIRELTSSIIYAPMQELLDGFLDLQREGGAYRANYERIFGHK